MTRGGFYALAFTLAALAWGLALLLATNAGAYDDADWCRDTLVAERQQCHGAHLLALADCAEARALERWLGLEDAQRNATECRNDADEACRECKADIGDVCGVVP